MVVALTSIALNLLSAGAAYGLLVLVFQDTWAGGHPGFHVDGRDRVAGCRCSCSWCCSGCRWTTTCSSSAGSARRCCGACRPAGGRRTASPTRPGAVTSAAIVMVGVFSIFATLSTIDMKQLGVGLAAAILLDATIIRAVVLPSAMTLLGKANWWAPRWMQAQAGGPARRARRRRSGCSSTCSQILDLRRPLAGAAGNLCDFSSPDTLPTVDVGRQALVTAAVARWSEQLIDVAGRNASAALPRPEGRHARPRRRRRDRPRRRRAPAARCRWPGSSPTRPRTPTRCGGPARSATRPANCSRSAASRPATSRSASPPGSTRRAARRRRPRCCCARRCCAPAARPRTTST